MTQADAPAPETSPAKRRLRWFQYRLRTLLLVMAILSAAFAGATWWVTLPLRTWEKFVARMDADDVEGTNALCDPATLHVVGNENGPEEAKAYAAPGRFVIGLSMIRGQAYEIRPMPRTWTEIVQGNVRIGIIGYFVPLGALEVRRNKVVFDADWPDPRWEDNRPPPPPRIAGGTAPPAHPADNSVVLPPLPLTAPPLFPPASLPNDSQPPSLRR